MSEKSNVRISGVQFSDGYCRLFYEIYFFSVLENKIFYHVVIHVPEFDLEFVGALIVEVEDQTEVLKQNKLCWEFIIILISANGNRP